MSSTKWVGALLALAVSISNVSADVIRPIRDELRVAERRLCGTIVDHTHHHGADRRIWAPSLCQCRDLYVYLPPCFDPHKQYPVMIWLHGFLQDERDFVEKFAKPFDDAIVCGKLPPMIIAAPDGSERGRATLLGKNSFFINSNVGNFEDYIVQDVWCFLNANYPIRPEREAHILAGISMGGFSAYNLALKHRDVFKVAIGIEPPLNLRWVNCHGRYFGNFDPNCWGWRESVDRRWEVIGRFGAGTIKIRLKSLVEPLFDRSPDAIAKLSYENPIEMIDRLGIVNGELDMFVGYAGKDGFNIDAQVESFLYLARERGICVSYCYEPNGHHNTRTELRLLPHAIDWLAECGLTPYFNP